MSSEHATERILSDADAAADAMSDESPDVDAYDNTIDTPAAANPDAAVDGIILYWSLRGEVACATHVPEQGSERWSEERWAAIPPDMRSRHGLRYQCQYCADTKSPILHRTLDDT